MPVCLRSRPESLNTAKRCQRAARHAGGEEVHRVVPAREDDLAVDVDRGRVVLDDVVIERHACVTCTGLNVDACPVVKKSRASYRHANSVGPGVGELTPIAVVLALIIELSIVTRAPAPSFSDAATPVPVLAIRLAPTETLSLCSEARVER